jgi:hypothetical protein
VSLVRPKLPENRDLNPEASFRVRGLKGFQPQQLVALNDPLYASLDVVHWSIFAQVTGVAGNPSKIGIQTRSDPNLVWIVDKIVAATITTTDQLRVGVTVGGAIVLVYTTDTNVLVRNRSAQEQNSAPTATGDLRIFDTSLVGVGSQIAGWRAVGDTPYTLLLGYRLFAAEQLVVGSTTAAVGLNATLFGRVMRR